MARSGFSPLLTGFLADDGGTEATIVVTAVRCGRLPACGTFGSGRSIRSTEEVKDPEYDPDVADPRFFSRSAASSTGSVTGISNSRSSGCGNQLSGGDGMPQTFPGTSNSTAM